MHCKCAANSAACMQSTCLQTPVLHTPCWQRGSIACIGSCCHLCCRYAEHLRAAAQSLRDSWPDQSLLAPLNLGPALVNADLYSLFSNNVFEVSSPCSRLQPGSS